MRLFIIHHHLLRGGVTGIIEAQITALHRVAPDLKLTVAVGNCEGKNFPGAEMLSVPALDYLTGEPEPAYAAIKQFLTSLPGDAIIHVHNPTLGKNPALTLALYEEASCVRPVFYHCHDFAEDRPENYHFLEEIIHRRQGHELKTVLYPDFPRCRFGVINRHDKRRLESYGIHSDRIDYLPNPAPEIIPASSEEGLTIRRKLQVAEPCQLWLYPVRAIRRKNLGEFLFLVTLFSDRVVGAITLPPNNPDDFAEYELWQQLAAELRLPIHFAVGNDHSLAALMAAADRCLTTSRREGFGMTFIEPWQYGKPVSGRMIAELMEDFQAINLDLSQCYDRLKLPNEDRDFGELSITEQQRQIRLILVSNVERTRIINLNPLLSDWLKPCPEAVITANATAIVTNLSLSEYGRKLNAAYQRLIG